MKKDRPPISVGSQIPTVEHDSLPSRWGDVIRRRSFLQGIGAAAAIVPENTLFAAHQWDDEREQKRLTLATSHSYD